ncbi:hypothetical protein SD427_01030 [Chryseobacterium sp. JJR-5R]|uniref:hypothetical protein n=1 Tax=Chryseobacterium sp. JJR-5R TaxID=3093923 RepID=UPI002A757FD7|nr:hypothetical protein [Chryseobacterium sp. JJR-5R]WPO82956.1 hypothetical protein SD427_01030 [Chryseobacterium sp. JJR-5R]
MKNIFKTFIILLFFCFTKIFGQLDTLNYLKQFEINKANYIGQPFSKLLNDMTQIHPKTAWSFTPFNNKNIVTRTSFNFCEKEHSFHNVINLAIFWETPIPRSTIKSYEQLNAFFFTNDEKSFYGSKIVKDIKVYR